MIAVRNHIIAALLLAILFWVVNFLGSINAPFHNVHGSDLRTAIQWDGILCMLIAYAICLILSVLFRWVQMIAISGAIALVLVAVDGYFAGYDRVLHGF
jgi:hypothetical protein